MNALISRNLRVYFRDKASVFFSLLSVMIIILLYALFLGDAWAGSSMFRGREGVRWLMDAWIMAGLLAVVSVTSTMGAYGIMVEDRSRKIIKDFYSSPLSRAGLTGGYILSAFVIGLVMSLLTAVLAVVYILARGGQLPALAALGKTFLLILTSTLSNTAMVLFLISFIKSTNAFSTASTLIGTLIGFLTGIYMPIGQLPPAVQTLIKVIPTSHAAALFRQTLMEQPIQLVFQGAPEEMVAEFKGAMGVTLSLGGHTFTAWEHVLVLAASFLLFSLLSLWSLSRKKK
jgi:multidrug/hemolysin transport system permease protein